MTLLRTISLPAALAAGAALPLLVGRVALASPQDAAPAPPPAQTAPAAPADTPEAKAQAALTKMATAYRDLKTFSATMEVKSTRPGKPAESVVTKITFARDAGAKVVSLAGSKVATAVFDGKTLYATDSTDPKVYQKETPITLTAGLAEAMHPVGLGLLSILLTDPDAGPKILPPGAVNVALEPKGPTIGGVKTQVVTAQFTVPSDPTSVSAAPAIVTLELAIGQQDSLLRRLTVTQSAPGGAASMVGSESYTDVKVNPALGPDAFKFTPPSGAEAKDVTETAGEAAPPASTK